MYKPKNYSINKLVATFGQQCSHQTFFLPKLIQVKDKRK